MFIVYNFFGIINHVKLKVFVTGASGMLGTTLYDVFTNVGYEIISTDLSPLDPWTVRLDVRNKRVVRSMIKKAKPDFVFNELFLIFLTEFYSYFTLMKHEV